MTETTTEPVQFMRHPELEGTPIVPVTDAAFRDTWQDKGFVAVSVEEQLAAAQAPTTPDTAPTPPPAVATPPVLTPRPVRDNPQT